jgi:hypothetical protein
MTAQRWKMPRSRAGDILIVNGVECKRSAFDYDDLDTEINFRINPRLKTPDDSPSLGKQWKQKRNVA